MALVIDPSAVTFNGELQKTEADLLGMLNRDLAALAKSLGIKRYKDKTISTFRKADYVDAILAAQRGDATALPEAKQSKKVLIAKVKAVNPEATGLSRMNKSALAKLLSSENKHDASDDEDSDRADFEADSHKMTKDRLAGLIIKHGGDPNIKYSKMLRGELMDILRVLTSWGVPKKAPKAPKKAPRARGENPWIAFLKAAGLNPADFASDELTEAQKEAIKIAYGAFAGK